MNRVHFASTGIDRRTPDWLFEQYDSEFHFTLDVCAEPHNARCPSFWSPAKDGLTQPWDQNVCWMNPPYGRGMWQWMQKAYASSLQGATVVCLLPARTDTSWWHDWVIGKAEIRYIKGRLRFNGAGRDAPFPSVIVIYRPDNHAAARAAIP